MDDSQHEPGSAAARLRRLAAPGQVAAMAAELDALRQERNEDWVKALRRVEEIERTRDEALESERSLCGQAQKAAELLEAERDEARAGWEQAVDVYARDTELLEQQRDEARASDQAARDRALDYARRADKARAELETVNEARRAALLELRTELERATLGEELERRRTNAAERERDEARTELERELELERLLRREGQQASAVFGDERDEARAQLESVERERDELVAWARLAFPVVVAGLRLRDELGPLMPVRTPDALGDLLDGYGEEYARTLEPEQPQGAEIPDKGTEGNPLAAADLPFTIPAGETAYVSVAGEARPVYAAVETTLTAPTWGSSGTVMHGPRGTLPIDDRAAAAWPGGAPPEAAGRDSYRDAAGRDLTWAEARAAIQRGERVEAYRPAAQADVGDECDQPCCREHLGADPEPEWWNQAFKVNAGPYRRGEQARSDFAAMVDALARQAGESLLAAVDDPAQRQ